MSLQAGPGAREVSIGPYSVELRVGDVADAAGQTPVVSSDDNYLSHGGGASAAVWRAVGKDLGTDPAVVAVRTRGERPGLAQVVVSRVGPDRVPVFHAITIDFDLGERLGPRDLGMLYTNLLNAADEIGADEIVMPLIGAGAGHVGAGATVTALLDVVLGRSLLPSGQRLSLVVLPRSLADASDAFDRWVAAHPTVALGEDASVSPSIPTFGLAVTASRPGPLVGRGSAAVGEASTGTRAPRHDRDMPKPGRGRWETLARDNSHAADVVAAARELDEAPNAKASGPAIQLWSLLDNRDAPSDAQPQELRQVIELARSARIRIAQREGDAVALLPELVRGIEVLLDPESASETIDRSSPILVGAVRVDWSPDGTHHVRQLHNLLRTSLSPDQLRTESQRLGDLGYQGEPIDRLLEDCVADDPIDVLQRHFSGSQLRVLLDQRGIAARASDPPHALARTLLHHLGFPRRDELVDPELVLREVEVLDSELHALAEPQLTGRIAGISRSLEAVLRTYLRFLTKGLLDTSPDRWLHERRDRRPTHRLPSSVDKATFGQLMVLVSAAAKQVDRSNDPRTRSRVDDLQETQKSPPRWLPPEIDQLRDERNIWVHGSPDDGDTALSVAEKRRQAGHFCHLARLILDGLINGPFPTVIVIEEISYDTWGRRHVRARTSKGTVENIFTDLELVPGQTYLMHARTNPLRVDPLLVRQATGADDPDI